MPDNINNFNISGIAAERSLQWYKDAILNGMKFQVKYARSNMWAQYKKYYRHDFPDGIIPVNLVFSLLRSIVPQVYFRNPAVAITPTKPGLEYELHARLVEDIDNWLLRELMTKYEIKKMINDAFLCGIATGFVGYDSEFGYDKSKTVEGSDIVSLTQFNKKGYRIEYNSHVNPGMPWFLRARPEDVVYPWGCESAHNAEWIAMRVFRPLQDIKSDPKYKDTSDLKGSFVKRRTSPSGTYSEPEDMVPTDHEWVELWQVRDVKTGEIVCLTMDHDKFLRKEADPLQIEGVPCETLVFNPDPDFIYGIPDVRIIEPQLLELNEIRTQAMKHRRVDILKLLYKKGAIKKEELDKLLDERVQAAVAIEGDADIGASVMALNPGASGILNDLARMGEIVRGDVREQVGFSRSSTGEYQGKTHISAAETDVVNWANQIRVDERRDVVADLLTNVVRRFNQLIFTHWTTSMVRSVVGPDGAKWWLQFSPSDIKGEYNIKVDPTNAVPVDQRTKRQDAIEMAKAWSEMNMGQVKAGMPVPAEIQRYFFAQFDGVNVDKLLAQQAQNNQMASQPGMNPGMPLPPNVAAQMMSQKGGGPSA
jgi:hypothetical protein